MAPFVLDIVVDEHGHVVLDDQGRPVHPGTAHPVEKDILAESNTLRPTLAVPLQEVVQQATQACYAAQSLNTIAAQAGAQLQRLMEPVASRIQQTTAAQVQTAFLTEYTRVQELLASQAEGTTRFQKMLSAIAEENTPFQQFQAEENKRLQQVAASFRTMKAAQTLINPDPPAWLATMQTAAAHAQEEQERLRRLFSSFQLLIESHWQKEQELLHRLGVPFQQMVASSIQEVRARAAQIDFQRFKDSACLINEKTERLHRILFPTVKEAARLQQIRDLVLRPPASINPERVQDTQRRQVALERHMCARALEYFSSEPEMVKQFVTQTIGLPLFYLGAVWQALHEGGWMNADKPLKYVWALAMRIHARDAEQNGSIGNSTLPASDNLSPEQKPRYDEEQRLKQQDLSAGMSSDTFVSLPTSHMPQGRDVGAQLALSPSVSPQRKRGRPPGSGTYGSEEDFRQAICPIIQTLRRQGTYPSLERVAELLPTRPNPRQLRRWVNAYLNMSWLDVLKTV